MAPSPPSPSLRVSINYIDHVLVPSGPLDRCKHPLVPVIRIFGDSTLGQKVCLTIHQVYPYFFIEYTGDLNPEKVNQYITRLTVSLNYALAISLKRDPTSPKSQFVRSVILVKGVHFYGFHSSYSPFLKILIAQPSAFSRAVAVMQSGVLMKTKFRIYESHLSFILQFMSDFGLFGCGWIDLDKELYLRRAAEQEYDQQEDVITLKCSPSADSNPVNFQSSPHPKQATSTIEIDVVSHQILNRHRVNPSKTHHRLNIPAPPLPSEPSVPSVKELWEDERARRAKQGLQPSPMIHQDPSEGSRSKGPAWSSEARFWDQLRERVTADGPTVAVQEEPRWARMVMTTFESMQALWGHPWRTWKPQVIDPTEQREYELSSLDNQNGLFPKQEDSLDDIDVDTTIINSQQVPLFNETDDYHHEISIVQDLPGEEDDEETSDFFNGDFPLDSEGPTSPIALVHNTEEENPFIDDVSGSPKQEHEDYTLPSVPQAEEPAVLDSDGSCEAQEEQEMTPPSRRPKKHRLRESPSPSPTPTKRVKFSDVITSFEDDSSNQVDEDGAEVFASPEDLLTDIPLPESGVSTPRPSPPHLPEGTGTRTILTRPFILQPKNKFIGKNTFLFGFEPPSVQELLSYMDDYEVPNKIYTRPHYSEKIDAPPTLKEFSGLIFDVPAGQGLETLEPWEMDSSWPSGIPSVDFSWDLSYMTSSMNGAWEYASSPPKYAHVKRWLNSDEGRESLELIAMLDFSQIIGPTVANSYGMKRTPLMKVTIEPKKQAKHMSILSLEVFAPNSESQYPDPDVDEIAAAFFSFDDGKGEAGKISSGQVTIETESFDPNSLGDPLLGIVSTELELLNYVVDLVLDVDPDILVGWEIQAASWSYLQGRGLHYGMDIAELIGRGPIARKRGGNDEWSLRKTSTFRVVGRHALNLWRVMRTELTLSIYTFENVVFEALGMRTPRYTSETLTRWYQSPLPLHVAQLFNYFARRTKLNLDILSGTDVLPKTTEFARVFGVDFFSVLSRGSQFKVESFMARIAKPESFVLFSPSKTEVGLQNGAECMPLIMEPFSAFYTSPLLVLDFQSLYPSVMIAYNYCYSTCLGRIQRFQDQWKFGVTQLNLPDGLLRTVAPYVTMAPNGMMYTKPTVRTGLLGRMLKELLDTRVMVKQSMKDHKSDKALERVLNARQLGLKYIANVTYGYTSASFSGRMPAVEIADSIVQSGREILEEAIVTIESDPRWGARVVYGDTDSVFVYLEGKTKEQAFQIGNEIADRVTLQNLAPIKLKFEKVYHPCLLMAKKRYVGFKYESLADEEPVFDAKGIETVRRDGVAAQRKMTETCLKILFRTQDLSEVKQYCWDSWMKILQGRASVQDFIFAKEVRLGTYSDKGAPPPGAVVAARRSCLDESDEIHYAERVPYVIAVDTTETRLADKAVSPHDLLDSPQKQLDAVYYITRVLIPPLDRIFSLLGADVRSWFDEMPRFMAEAELPVSPTKRKAAEAANMLFLSRFDIKEHFEPSRCIICGEEGEEGLCAECFEDPLGTYPALMSRLKEGESKLKAAQSVCQACTGLPPGQVIECVSLDCPWLYERKRIRSDLEINENIGYLLEELALAAETEEEDDVSKTPSKSDQETCLGESPSVPSPQLDSISDEVGNHVYFSTPTPSPGSSSD